MNAVVVAASPTVMAAASDLAASLGYLANNYQTQEEFIPLWQSIAVTPPTTLTAKVDCFSGRDGPRIVYSSGGSTGNPKFSIFAMSEALDNARVHGSGYRKCGINAEDTVATWGAPGLLSAEFAVPLGLSETGCLILPIGADSPVDAISGLLVQFEATVLLVMPSDLFSLEAHFEAVGIDGIKIRMIVTGGEPLTNRHRQRLVAIFGPDLEFASVLQAVESGSIGYQCRRSASNIYHVHDADRLVEIVELDEYGRGELVVTNPNRRLVPSLRRKTGDVAAAIPGPCECGDVSPRIELHGRSGSRLKVGGEIVDIGILLGFMDDLDDGCGNFRVEITTDVSGRDVAAVRSDLLMGDVHAANSARALFQNLHPKFCRRIARGELEQLTIYPWQGSAQRTGVGGKIIKLVDLRG